MTPLSIINRVFAGVTRVGASPTAFKTFLRYDMRLRRTLLTTLLSRLLRMTGFKRRLLRTGISNLVGLRKKYGSGVPVFSSNEASFQSSKARFNAFTGVTMFIGMIYEHKKELV